MTDYKKLKAHCRDHSAISEKVLDEFLLYYAAERDKLDKEADRRLGIYRHITQKIDKSWFNMLKSQYILHRVMKKEGLVHKYLKHAALQNMDPTQRKWLEKQATRPWRFSFSIITDNPADDFYEMLDVFTEETYLLYSPGMTDTLKEGDRELWFNLIGFNGSCWQSYGPMAGYTSFDPDDIFFFATELNPAIEDDDELMADVSKNPVPYMMLFSGSLMPETIHQDDSLVIVIAEREGMILDLKKMKKDFSQEHKKGVYRLGLKDWEHHPHFSVAYYDEENSFLQVTALTEKGFVALVDALNTYKLDLDDFPDIHVKPGMLTTATDILKRKIELMPYELLFEPEKDPKKDEEMDKFNQLLGLALPYINEGKIPDYESLAKQTGMDVEYVKDFMEQVMADIKKRKK